MGRTVSVGCKLPCGIKLHTLASDGTRVELKLNGTRVPNDGKGAPLVGAFAVVGEYGITSNVDGDLWDKILAESRGTPPFTEGMIFALEDADMLRDMAKEAGGHYKSGFEPMDPDKPGPGLERASG